MPRSRLASVRIGGTAILAALIIVACSANVANADPCAIACRSQHNACRMATKLLYTPRCDAQLQACISQCFAAARFNRGAHEGRGPDDFRDRRGPPPDMRLPPERRGPPREFNDPRGPRWLGAPGRWGNFR